MIKKNHTPLAVLLIAFFLQACGNSSSTSSVSSSTSSVAPNYSLWFFTAMNATNRNSIGTGTNVQVRVVDTGLQYTHFDLADQISAAHSYDLIANQPSTATYSSSGPHGTAVAGLIAASDNNVGGTGIAPQAKISGYNYLDKTTSINLNRALSSNLANISILNNSWGNPDNGLLYPLSNHIKIAINDGINNGRSGLGSIYVWAAGNGGSINDNSNYGGFAAYRNVLAVAAVRNDNSRASYSEKGANLWISAPSGNSNACQEAVSLHSHLITTDLTGTRGYSQSDYTTCFSGTSGSAPLISGSIALMLAANASLGWRDVYEILARSATKNDSSNSDWQTNTAGLNFNHSYGFGLINTQAAVEMSRSWSNITLPQLNTTYNQTLTTNNTITAGTELTSVINVSSGSISHIEHVEINIDLQHTLWSDLAIQLTHSNSSTHSITSILTESRSQSSVNTSDFGRQNNSMITHTFTANAHFLDNPKGTWTLRVKDANFNHNGVLNGWSLTFYGR